MLKPRESITTLAPYRSPLGDREGIHLDLNENAAGCSERVLTRLRTLTSADISRYPNREDGERVVAKFLGLPPEQVLLTNGIDEGLYLLSATYLGEGDEMLFADPTFVMYPIYGHSTGARVVRVASDEDFAFPAGKILAAISPRTRLITIANPNNPVGTWLGAGELRAFLDALPPAVIAVVDEAYFEYSRDVDCADASLWIRDLPNLVVTRTFSKAYGLAGLRVGYALSHPDVADLLNRVRQPFNVNSVALAAAEAALDDAAHIAASVELNRAGLVELRRGLAELGLRVLPSAGNFVLVDFGRPAAPIYDALLREGVIVRPVAGYGLPDALRITVGTTTENARCLDALARVPGASS